MRGLKDKVAVVTGGAGRIGQGVVKRLVDEGAIVVVADVNLKAAEETAARYLDKAVAIGFDAAAEESIRALIDETIKRFGRIDILHNNAALVNLGELGVDTTALETPLELWDATMNINVRGYLVACRHALPHMIAQGGGSIINTSSGSGHRGDNVRLAYGTSKGAVSTLTLYIAAQHGKQNIRCNAIAPGMIADDKLMAFAPKLAALNERHSLTPRIGNPDDIGALVAFLASDDSAFITGQIINVDGGLQSHSPQMVEAIEMGPAYS